MTSSTTCRTRCEQGYVLPAVTVLAFVLILGGLALFMTASYENKHTNYTSETTQAFMLADAGVERARATLLSDRTWRTGWTNVTLAGGTYTVAIADTTITGLTGAFVNLTSVGIVDDARRGIAIVAEVPPASMTITALAVTNLTANATMSVEGRVHVNGTGDFGNHGQHLHDGELTTGFTVTPPHIYTDAAHLPGSTYYEVHGTKIGGVYQARIYDAVGNDVTTALGDSLTGVTSYDAGSGRYEFDFGSASTLNDYFDQDTGVFLRAPGDVSVVVNFGESPFSSPPGPHGVADVLLRGNGGTVLESTIINTRFDGVTTDQRLDSSYWSSGLTEMERLTVEPPNGISVICGQLEAGNHCVLGSDDYPGLVYITGGPSTIGSDLDLHGNLISMGDLTTGAHVTINFNPAYFSLLPAYFVEEMLGGVSGTLDIMTWREFAPPAPSS